MFGRKKEDNSKDMVKNDTQKKPAVDPKAKVGSKPRRHWVLKTFLILLLLSLAGYGGYVYVENVKAASYIQGGQDAIGTLTKTVEEKGGAAIEINGKVVTVSAYYKPIGEGIVTGNAVVDTTESEAATEEASTEETTETTEEAAA